MDNGGESNDDSFFIEGQSNSGPSPGDDNFAEDGGYGPPGPYPQGGHYGGPRGPPMGPRGPMGMRGPMRPYGGPMGPRPYGMRGPPPHGPYNHGPRPPPRGPPGPPQRFQGPPPRGMGPRGPPPNMQGGYGDYQSRQMRPPHFQSDASMTGNGMDGPNWEMGHQNQGPPGSNQSQQGPQGYMGGQQVPPPQNYGNSQQSQQSSQQGYGNGPPQQPPHGYNSSGVPPFSTMPPNMGAPYQQSAQQQQPPSQPSEMDMNGDIWVETKTGDGKSYYYHAKTRETTWTKPEGPTVKILTQQQVEAMAQQTAARPAETGAAMPVSSLAAAPYGMSPQQNYYPPAQGWNMPVVTPVPTPVLAVGPQPYPLMFGPDPGVDPALTAPAMEWCEYRSPEGKPYYFNLKTSQSVWEKPQGLKDYDVGRLAAAARAHAGSLPLKPEIVLADVRKDDVKVKESDSKETNKDTKEKEESKAPKDKSRPVSSTPVTGTPWCVVWTGDGRVFFYNPSTRSSVWEKPDDLKNRVDVDKMVANPPDSTPGNSTGDSKEDIVIKDDKLDKKKKTDGVSNVEEPPIKKSRVIEEVTIDDVKMEGVTKDNAMEAEVKAAQQRAIIPLEERIQQFKEMLAEKEVSAFSTWEKELHKIVFDSRYLLLTSKERKDVYEEYVRERVEEERREKRNRMKEKKDDFRKLMEEAKLTGKSTFADFCHRHGKDDRFRGVEKTRERESLFNEFIIEVRRREKEERESQREKVKKDFISFLREQLGDQPLERHSRWAEVKRKLEDTKDHRFRNVDSSLREDYYRDWLRDAREKMEKREKEREKERERERERDKERSSKKDRDRDRDRSDRDRDRKDRDSSRDRKDKDKDKDKEKDKERSRDKEKSRKEKKDKDRSKGKDGERSKTKSKDKEKRRRKSDTEEEGETRDDENAEETGGDDKTNGNGADRYRDEEMVDEDQDQVYDVEEEEEKERRDRERKAREEASLREREKEVQRALAPHLRDRDKERQAHQHGEAVQHFTALLTDLIRNPDVSWKEAKRVLRKDSRSEVTEMLQKEEKEKMFTEHIEKLAMKKRVKFREMLEEISDLTLTTTWKKIRNLIKEDPRYGKFSSSDRKCEKEFNEFMKDKMVAAKADFRELLKESKFISFKTLKSVRESEPALKDLEATLSKDRRYLQLDCIRQERQELLMEHLAELERRGPPPPPTATEPTRRDKH